MEAFVWLDCAYGWSNGSSLHFVYRFIPKLEGYHSSVAERRVYFCFLVFFVCLLIFLAPDVSIWVATLVV